MKSGVSHSRIAALRAFIRATSDQWRRANAIADNLPPESRGAFFREVSRALVERLQAADHFDRLQVEIEATDAVQTARERVIGRLQ